MNLLIDIQYFGNLNYYLNIVHNTDVYFDEYVPYSKRGFYNRCTIAGANGPILLSVPVKNGRTQKTIFKDVEIIDDLKWQLDHWKSLLSAYNGSPWFNFLKDSLSCLYFKRFKYLLDWDLACLEWSLDFLALDIHYFLLSGKEMAGKENRRGGSWETEHIETADQIRYRQVFEDKNGFIPNLSILDILCCEGPTRTLYLLGSAKA